LFWGGAIFYNGEVLMPYILKVNQRNVDASYAKQDGRKVNDVVSIRHSIEKLSGREKSYLTLVEITEQQLAQLHEIEGRVRKFYKSDCTDWTDKMPIEKDGWVDDDGSVYEVAELPFSLVSHNSKDGLVFNLDKSKNRGVVLKSVIKGDKIK